MLAQCHHVSDSIRLSVHLSVTSQYWIKMAANRITQTKRL